MSFSFPNSKKERKIILLDVGSASVGGAVAVLKEGVSPTILFNVREDMVLQDDLNMNRFTSSMLEVLERILEKIVKSGVGFPNEFFCVLSSPWYESTTKIVTMKKEEPFTVTHKILGVFIEKEVDEFKSNMRGTKKGGLLEIIDTKNIQMKLNGYETGNPYGKKVKNFEAAVFMSLGSKEILDAIRGKIFRASHSKDIEFSTFSLSAFSAVRDIFTDKDNFLFLDITGEVSDVMLVNDGVPVKTASFPLGENFIVRSVASGMNTTFGEVKSLLNMHIAGKDDGTLSNKLDDVLSIAQKKWLQEFKDTAARVSEGTPLPSTIFFTADIGIAHLFEDAIKEGGIGQFTTVDEIFDIRFLSPNLLAKFCSFKDGVEKDPFIILEAIFADRSMI